MSDTGRSPRELEALLEGEHRRGAREVREPRRRGVEDLGELERLDGAHLVRVRVRGRLGLGLGLGVGVGVGLALTLTLPLTLTLALT